MRKVLTLEESIKVVGVLKTQGKIIVLVGGCFDLLHPGHLVYLEKSKEQGDVLFVALESDENTKRMKGKARPVNKQRARARALAALGMVDYVILLPTLLGDEAYFKMVEKISPSVIAVTGGDPKYKEKKQQALLVGGKVVVATSRLKDYSTTKILEER